MLDGGRKDSARCRSVGFKGWGHADEMVEPIGSVVGMATVLATATAKGEDLSQAWGIALGVNQQVQAQQQSSIAASFEVKAANSARYFTVRSYNIDAFLAQSPKTKPTVAQNSSTGSTGTGSTGSAAATAFPTVFILGSKQTFLPISLTTASIPLYTGGS